MITLTIARKHKEEFETAAEAIAKFKELRDESANNGERADAFHKAKLKVGKVSYRISYNGKVWDKEDNLVEL